MTAILRGESPTMWFTFRRKDRSRQATKPRPPRRVRLRVECLEERCVPASNQLLMVTTNSNSAGVSGSLPFEVNIANGDFVFSLTESYLIEDGKLTAPLKGVNLIGNGPDVLSKVDLLGSDLEISDGIWTCGKEGQSVPVGVGCPTVRISQITVGGTKIG